MDKQIVSRAQGTQPWLPGRVSSHQTLQACLGLEDSVVHRDSKAPSSRPLTNNEKNSVFYLQPSKLSTVEASG